jgi:hypothetical protein
MSRSFGKLAWLLCAALVTGACASSPQVTRYDLSDASGLLLIVYAERSDLRASMEDRLAAELDARGMIGHPSHRDLADIVAITPEQAIAAARARKAAGVLVVNPVTPDGTERVVQNPARIPPEHPDLQAFFANVRAQAGDSGDSAREVIVETNLFLLGDAGATLFWSGAAMTVAADGRGAGLRDLSAQIAAALERARRELRGD